ncbi:hypothetical protein [Antrihabitans stalactiti]|uniref:hypothetical protein n=1 Tax=Antrihabitans stalactiti TaxID=2584121 RepID=UPI00146EE2FF|nr:hypothetical protein [Antrihabitans stalactiti]
MVNDEAEGAPDVRAKWRKLPDEPAYLVEETVREHGYSTNSMPGTDAEAEWILKYGLGG